MTYEEDLENLARQICCKPTSVYLKECHNTWGRTNNLCCGQVQCRILEKSHQQISYVLSTNEKDTLLKACPGSGKTEVVGLKAAYVIHSWQGFPSGIAVLTFTNDAADEIKGRVTQFVGEDGAGYPHYIGTLDSWLHGYIANPFAHLITGYKGRHGDRSINIVDDSSESGFLNAFLTRWGLNTTGKPMANQYYIEREPGQKECFFSSGNHIIDERRNSCALEPWRIQNLKDTKQRFWASGFATYQDIEIICLDLLVGYNSLCRLLAKRFPFLIVDECQDLSWIQLQILDKLRGEGTKLHLVGDLNQGIYEFRKVNPQKVALFTKERDFIELPLNSNFRSCQPIADLCNRLISDVVAQKSDIKQIVENPCICVQYPKDQISLLPDWFVRYLNSKSVSIEESAIVTRNRKNVSRLRPAGNASTRGRRLILAAAFLLWKAGDVQSLEDSLSYLGRFIAETYFANYSSNLRHYHCPECVDSFLRWRLFLSGMLNDCCRTERKISDLNVSWQNWAQSVRSELGDIARSLLPLLTDSVNGVLPVFDDLDGRRFRVPTADRDKTVLSSLPKLPKVGRYSNIKITTIHRVKGKTLDALLLVSAPDTRGTNDGYWEQWLADKSSEAARLAYVASSRPKHLLAWAIPDDGKDLSKITELGFHIVSLSRD
jgi:DNA helicase II / ATP-dependent DNA helicase PcrA